MLANMSFLLKFWITFGILSVTTGNLMGIVIAQVYEKILSLAFALVNATNLPNSQHFFAAQQEILHDATTISTGVAMTAYFFIGLNISRYMTTMLYVFTRALEEDRFPVQLRLTDVYHGLAAIMNNARQKIR